MSSLNIIRKKKNRNDAGQFYCKALNLNLIKFEISPISDSKSVRNRELFKKNRFSSKEF